MQVNLLLFDIHSISVSHSEIPLKQIDEYAQKHLFAKGKVLNYQYWIQVLASLNINLLYLKKHSCNHSAEPSTHIHL